MSRNILITGVSSGIGLGLAQHWLRQGWRVYGISRRSSPCQGQAGFAEVLCDLTDSERVPTAVGELLGPVSAVEIVVLNAGALGTIADLQATRLESLRNLMEVNLWANKTLLDSLFARGVPVRQVAAISSGAAVKGNRGWGGYAISKAALNMLVQLYAAELPTTHFSAIAPGLVETAMQDYLCGLPPDDRFPSLANLRQRKGGPGMPTPSALAPQLAALIEQAPDYGPSGQYLDLREVTAQSAAKT